MNRKQVLVVCYSLTGNTARIARELAKRLDADVEIIREVRQRKGVWALPRATIDALRNVASVIAKPELDPARYAITVIGTPVWAGRMTPAVRAYLEQTKQRLRSTAFFITSGNTVAESIATPMAEVAHCRPMAVCGFNTRELHQADVCETKLAAFVDAVQTVRGVTPLPIADHAA